MTTKKALTVVTARWQEIFLDALRRTGHVGISCETAKVSRNTAYVHRRQEGAFAKAWDVAIEDAAFTLEDEALRRARDGVDEPIVYKGIVIGTQKRYSDTLLIFLLKGIKPDRWGEKFTIRLDPQQVAMLQERGMTPSEAWDMLMQEIASERDE